MGQPSRRVLLVDDTPLIRKLISGYLVAAGYIVRVAVDGLDAIGKLRAGHTDWIISDLNMPRMSGLEFLGVVRKRFPQIPVIVISSVAADEMPEGVAADAYFHKNGNRFELLLEIMADLTRNPPSRIAPPHFDNEPVQAIWERGGNYTIACGDCLRVSSVRDATHLGPNKMWTICVHCGGVIRFPVADAHPEGAARP